MSQLIDGFNPDISNEDYHGDRTYISSSGLKLVLKDPRQFYKTYVLNEESASLNQSAMDLGSYIHALILEPHLVEKEFAVFDGAMRRGKAWEEFEKSVKEGQIIITKSQDVQAQDLVRNFYDTELELGDDVVKVSSFFEGGNAEETLCGELDGLRVKVRFDYRKEGDGFASINDIKTTSKRILGKRDAEDVCAAFGYHISAALYVDLVEKETGKKHDFYFCFLSKKDGQTTLFKASEQMLERGRQDYKQAIQLIKKGRETGIWYEAKIQEIDAI